MWKQSCILLLLFVCAANAQSKKSPARAAAAPAKAAAAPAKAAATPAHLASRTGSAPEFVEITNCPEEEGLQLYEHPDSCHEFYKCANGTLTFETCENGLLFDGKGAIHEHCNYHWAVDCQGRASDVTPVGRGVCEFSFGIFTAGPCETNFVQCAFDEPITSECQTGLAYDERIHACNWPDLLENCDPSAIVGFRCPEQLDPRDPALKFLPFPRFAADDCGHYITCVEDQPRLIGCGDLTVFNPETLSCEEPENVPACAHHFK